MKKLTRNGLLLSTSALLLSLICPTGIEAAETMMNDSDIRRECTSELIMRFFPESIVKETLKKFNVPESKWDGIAKDLGSRDKDIMKNLEALASQLSPNPTKDPQARVKMLREKLLEVFTASMNENGITDSTQFQAMVDEIQKEKVNKYHMCIQNNKMDSKRDIVPVASISSKTPVAKVDDEEDEDDVDDDSDDEDNDDYDDEDDADEDDDEYSDDEDDEEEEESDTLKKSSAAKTSSPAPKK